LKTRVWNLCVISLLSHFGECFLQFFFNLILALPRNLTVLLLLCISYNFVCTFYILLHCAFICSWKDFCKWYPVFASLSILLLPAILHLQPWIILFRNNLFKLCETKLNGVCWTTAILFLLYFRVQRIPAVFSIFFNSQNLTITRLPVNKFGWLRETLDIKWILS